ncbi:tenascin-like isoform X2 [Dreissena polymorpha]|nr:tenascin-like isoform X2 [Dreissena polymorpha]
MPSSVPCITTRNYQSGQECYAKYAMKHDGTIMYEFGCHNSQTCPGQMGTHALIGKRATGDIELCYKCCQGDMCNQGTICTASPSTPSPSTTMSTTTAPATPVNPCSSSPCVHGSCFISSANPVTFFCMCPRGFEGVHCETIITSTASASTYTLPTATVITAMLAPTNVITISSQTTVITTIVAPTSVISTSSPTTGGDVCLACVDSPVTRACHYTRTCESHEVFQKRFNGRESFHRNFIDYENGFGDVNAEHWLGLKYIQEITSAGSHRLRLDVTHFNRSKGYDVYDNFSLQPGPAYTMNLGARLELSGLQLRYAINVENGCRGCAFSTYDHDVDEDHNQSCAYYFQGGWWYNSCYTVNLNGLYLPGSLNDTAMCFSHDIGLTASTMMFKKK